LFDQNLFIASRLPEIRHLRQAGSSFQVKDSMARGVKAVDFCPAIQTLQPTTRLGMLAELKQLLF
jgi:hypothetical protein